MYPYSLFYFLCVPRPMLVFVCIIKYFILLIHILQCTYIPLCIQILVHAICSLIYCILLIVTCLFSFCIYIYIFVLSLVLYDRSVRKRTDPWTFMCVVLKNPGRWSLRECVKHLKLSSVFKTHVYLFSQIVYLFIYLFWSTDIVQFMKYLPSTNEALALSLMLHKLVVVVHSWNSRTQKVKAHRSETERHSQQHREFQANLGYVKPWDEGQYEL